MSDNERSTLLTPDQRLAFTMLAALAYVLSPVAYGFWLWTELESGAFPPESDTISIPFMGFVLLWFGGLVAIPVAIFIFAVCRDVWRFLKRKERFS
jgi:hypothetical protein